MLHFRIYLYTSEQKYSFFGTSFPFQTNHVKIREIIEDIPSCYNDNYALFFFIEDTR